MSEIKKFVKSFSHAFRGIGHLLKHENSFRIQVFVAVLVLILISFIPLASWERILIILMTASVLVLEIINSIFERISDALKPRLHPMVKDIKDMMAGAVLITSITAIVVAVMIFWSYFL